MLMVGYADIASENEKKNICLSSNMDFAAAYNCNVTKIIQISIDFHISS